MKRFSTVAGLLFLVLVSLWIIPALAQSLTSSPFLLYVSPTGLDTNTGLSWSQAKQTIQGAVASALSTGASVYVADGNFTLSTQVNDLGKPVAIYLGRGTYSTSLAAPFLLTSAGSSIIGAQTTDTSGGTSSGTVFDYTGSAKVNFITGGSPTSSFASGEIENLVFNFGNASPGSNGVLLWGAQRARVRNLMATTMAGTEIVSSETEATGDGGTTSFSFTLPTVPVEEYEPNKPGNYRLTIVAGTVTGTDQGNGAISGTGVSGTVEYSTGYVTLTYTTAPANGTGILASYASGGNLAALLSTRENGLGIRTSPFGFWVGDLDGAGTTAKLLVQGEATGAAGSSPSYASDGTIENDDVAQFELNWSKNVTVLRSGTENAASSLPSPAFSLIEDPSGFLFGAVCGSQVKGLSTYLSGTITSYAEGC